MSFDRGAIVKIDGEFKDAEETLADPTALKLLLLPPDGELVTHTWPPDGTIVKDATGLFHCEVTLDQEGVWQYRWEASGAVSAPADGDLTVLADDFGGATDELRLFRPTVDEVAAHIRARTKDSNGNELGTFNEDTLPTARQVEELIPRGVRRVTSAVGTTICEGDDATKQAELYEDARDLAAFVVALRIERTYYPEQVGSGRSPYKEMLDDYKEAKTTLIEAVAEHCGGGDGESVGGDGGAMPSSSFPPPTGIASSVW